jgi:alpha-mannosidase
LSLLKQATFRTVVPLPSTHYLPTSPAPLCRPSDLPADAWRSLERGDTWGQPMTTVWLWQQVDIPAELHGERVALHLLSRADATQWSPDMIEGQLFIGDALWAGLDAEHRLAFLPPLQAPTDVFLQAHVGQPQAFGGFELVVVDPAAERLYHTMRVGVHTVTEIGEDTWAGSRLLDRLNQAYQLLDLREGIGPRFRGSVNSANEYLDQHLLEGLDGGARPQIVATGHAHLDVAWLWPLWRTRQKAGHTFATMLRLMEEYPSFCFSASTPQVYQFVKDDFPDLYEQIKQRVAEGRWEPIGGMWVEADCNVPSGESLVRQFVHGMRFFQEEFGVRDRVLWLPDVFGYSAALPQILRGVGIDTFMTTKISWNQFNRMPHDTFRWRGIDGSEVLTHFVTTPEPHTANNYYTYNGLLTPADVAGAWREYRQKTINDELLYLAGYGDGGGGVTREQIETAARLGDMPGMPQVRWGTANEYFQRLHERVDAHPQLPVWAGELYLEYHRGTYTSQAGTKQNNRRAELLYHDAEFLDAWASALPGYTSQREKLNEGWKLILLNQFHDILPGSSIRPVYEDAEKQYAEIVRIGGEVRDAALAALVDGTDDQLFAVNTLGWERTDPVFVPEQVIDANERQPSSVQPVTLLDGTAGVLVAGYAVGACGVLPMEEASLVPQLPPLTITPTLLENQFFRIALDDNGEITSIWNKRIEREVVAPEQWANALVAFEDRPLNYDAWDIDIFYEEKPYPVQDVEGIEVVEHGPIRGGVEITRRFGNSTIRQRILIYNTLARIDFATEIDWHEHQMLLKAAFPVDINAPRATYEIQFGAVERPTHRNTSWDMARFETCAQRWVDLSEGDYGVALLNDGKYGYDVHNNVLRLTLLKSGVYPDPQADQGTHRFTYSLLPHTGDWRAGEVVRRAAELNTPLLAVRGQGTVSGNNGVAPSFVTCDAQHVVLDTIKTAENGDGIMVRLYEAHNARGPVTLTFGQPVAHAERCNLLEEHASDVAFDGNTVRFRIKPFEIVTLRVRFSTL